MYGHRVWCSQHYKNCLGFLLLYDPTGHKSIVVGGTRRVNISKPDTHLTWSSFYVQVRILTTCSKDSTGYSEWRSPNYTPGFGVNWGYASVQVLCVSASFYTTGITIVIFLTCLQTQVLLSSALQEGRRFSFVFHIVISHCSITTRFADVTCDTALRADLQWDSLGPDPRMHLCELLLLPICKPRLLLLHDCQLLKIFL